MPDATNHGPPPPVYRITLRALPSNIPAVLRLRRALKHLLRSCDLRCVDVVEVKDGGDCRPDAPTP